MSVKNTCHGPARPFKVIVFSKTDSFPAMSQHKSLQGSSGIVVKRNVLKRFERLDLLKKRGQWNPGDRIVGLRKTKPDV